MDLNEAAVLVKVVQAGGFSAAARLLGLPTSTVSARVARLEKRLGVTLLRRTTRRLHVTEAGQLYYQHASAGLAQMLAAEAAVTEALGAPRGALRVTAPVDLGDQLLGQVMNLMRQHWPQVSVDMVLMNRHADLIGEGIDVAIRAGALRDSTLIAKRVGVALWVPFASPAHLATTPALDSPQDLRHHCCLQFTPIGKDAWTLRNPQGSVTVPMSGQVLVNDVGVIRSMALAGAGVALLPSYLCQEDCDQGRLVRVLSDWHANADPIHIVYPRQSFVPPSVRVFVDLASEALRERLEGVRSPEPGER